MTVPKMLAIFAVLLIVDLGGMATGLVYQLVEGAREVGIPQYIGWFILPDALNGLLIAILAVFFQVLSPNKYVGWGLLFVWFVAGIFLSNMGYCEPALQLRRAARTCRSATSSAQASFWWGEAVMLFYWLCFATILVVIAHLIWPRGTDLALRSRLSTDSLWRSVLRRSASPALPLSR